VTSLMDKLARVEKDLLSQTILSPVIPKSKVTTRINGVVISFSVSPRNYTGFGLFQPIDYKNVQFVEDANFTERRRYLELFPRVKVIVVAHDKDNTAVSLAHSDGRFSFATAPIHLVENISLLDIVYARFNGSYFLYDSHSRGDTRRADFLKATLTAGTTPDKVEACSEDRAAYRLTFDGMAKLKELTEGEKIKLALERAGGKLNNYKDRGDSYTISYVVNNQTFSSVVNKDLSVQNAGICLNGGDRVFDLTSLVSVVREGQSRGLIHRTLRV
jgi:hypothetical protein